MMFFNGVDLDRLLVQIYPEPVLRQKADPVDPESINDELSRLAERMIETMVQSQGIGLAAPQVGLPIRLIVISPTGKSDDAEVLINPELSHFQGSSEMEEGCLSLPGVRGKVRRAQACAVTALDLDGNRFVMEAADLTATVLQHETDHLDGVLFIDRLSTISRMKCRRAIRALDQEYRSKHQS